MINNIDLVIYYVDIAKKLKVIISDDVDSSSIATSQFGEILGILNVCILDEVLQTKYSSRKDLHKEYGDTLQKCINKVTNA